MLPEPPRLIIVGPDTLIEKIRAVSSEIARKLMDDLGDIFKVHHVDKLINCFHYVLRVLVPMYIFLSDKDDLLIRVHYELRHERDFDYELRAKICMGAACLTFSVSNAFYLTVDVASLIELIRENIDKKRDKEALLYLDSLTRELSKRLRNMYTINKVLEIIRSGQNQLNICNELIKMFSSREQVVSKGLLKIDLAELFDNDTRISDSPLLAH